jgi:hypothetical protein
LKFKAINVLFLPWGISNLRNDIKKYFSLSIAVIEAHGIKAKAKIRKLCQKINFFN